MNLNVNKIIFWQGTGRIIDACRTQQVPEPQWSINGDFIVVTFPRPKVPQDVPQDIDLDKWIENQIAIRPKITTEELANLSGKTSKTIKRHIAKMPHIKNMWVAVIVVIGR